MPRTSEGPRYYRSKKAWYANLGGERILLVKGPKKETAEEAEEKYEAEAQARKVEAEGDRNTAWAILNAYLHDCEIRVKNGDLSESTRKMHWAAIQSFNNRYGTFLVRNLRPQHVTEWLAEMRQPRWHKQQNRELVWGEATVKLAKNVLKRAFNWAVGESNLRN